MALSQIELSDRIDANALQVANDTQAATTDTLARTANLYELGVSVALELVTLYGQDTEKASKDIVAVLARYGTSVAQANTRRDDDDQLPVVLDKATVTRARRAEPVLRLMRSQGASVKDLTTVHGAITSQKVADSIAHEVKIDGPAYAAQTVRDEKAAKTAKLKAERAEAKRVEEADTRNAAMKAVDAILSIDNPTDDDMRLDAARMMALAEYLAAQGETMPKVSE